MRTPSVGRLVLSLLIVFSSASCGSDPVAPTMETIAGAYEATSFVAEGADILAAGGSLSLVLDANGTVSGSFFVPASVGGPLQADMAGTYSISGTSVAFTQEADTFVRDASWIWMNGVLEGSFGTGPGAVSVSLERFRGGEI